MQVEQDEQEKQEQEQQEQDSAGVPNSGEGEEGEGQGSSPDSSDGDEDSEGAGSSAGGLGDDETTEEGQGSSGSQTDESGEDSGQSMEDDTDDGESADSTEGESSEGENAPALEYDDYTNNEACAGSTQRSFEQGVSEMRDEETGDYTYATIPNPNLDQIVVDFNVIATMWESCRGTDNWDRYSEPRAERLGELRTFQNSIKATVNQMVQQFQMKQAADADARTEIAKTGILDTVSMINYRWSEDIFLKNEVHPDGKNHGMVMYVDWSGSMTGILQDTIEQLLVLVEFCRKVGIPYEVYAFSSNLYCPYNSYEDRDNYDAWYENRPKMWDSARETDCEPHDFQLYNFLSSRMNKRQYQTGLNNLWILTNSQEHYNGHPYPGSLSLGCTPLNEAVVCAMQQVPEFQRQNNIQIVNTVFLTDGEGHGMVRGGYYYSGRRGKTFVRDHRSRRTYEIAGRGRLGETGALLNMLRDRTGSNLVGIRLHDAKNIKHLRYELNEDNFEALSQQYKNENYITLPSAYDEYFIVKGNLKVETDALDNLGDHESYTRIKNAFIKGGNRKKSSRVIASKMVNIFAA